MLSFAPLHESQLFLPELQESEQPRQRSFLGFFFPTRLPSSRGCDREDTVKCKHFCSGTREPVIYEQTFPMSRAVLWQTRDTGSLAATVSM